MSLPQERPSSVTGSFDADLQRALELSKQEQYMPPSVNSVDSDFHRALELSMREDNVRPSTSRSAEEELQRALELSTRDRPEPSNYRAHISKSQREVALQSQGPPRRPYVDASALQPPPPVPPRRPLPPSPQNSIPPPPPVPAPPSRLPGAWVFDNIRHWEANAKPNPTPPRPAVRAKLPEPRAGNNVTGPRTPSRPTPPTPSTTPISSVDPRSPWSPSSEPATGQTTPAAIFCLPRRRMRHKRDFSPEASALFSPQTLPPFDLSENANVSTIRPTSTFTLSPSPDLPPLENPVPAFPHPSSTFSLYTPINETTGVTYPTIPLPTTTFSLSLPLEDFNNPGSIAALGIAPSSVLSLRPIEDVERDEPVSPPESKPTTVFSLAAPI